MLGWLKRLIAKPKDQTTMPDVDSEPHVAAPRLPYRVYTREFDVEMQARAAPLVGQRRYRDGPPTQAELEDVLDGVRLDARIHEWVRDFSEGFRNAETALGATPVVTILIDHSGSMRGTASREAVRIVELIAEMLESTGTAFEVLGFTTVSWKGGSSYGRWLNGGPPLPGRLCELLHIVYREADGVDPSWRTHLKLLLDDDFLKENVDGEALQWAHRRAQMLAPSTWICLVISDGAPVDDATLMHNESDILYDHLQRVIADLEAMPNVRLGAIGLRYDVAPLYRCAASIEVFPMDPKIPAMLFKRLMFGEQDVGEGKLLT